MNHTTRILCVLIAFTVMGCGDSAIDSNNWQRSSASLSIRWRTSPDDTGLDSTDSRYVIPEDCPAAGVDKVQCKVYGDGKELTSQTWNCSDRRGKITDIPPGSDRRFVVFGLDADGQILYRGQSDRGHECASGQTVSVGYIDAIPFIPGRLEPVEGALVNVVDPNLKWDAINGASEYHVIVSQNDDLSDPITDIDVLAANHLTSGLTKNQTYYWRVHAEDEFNNASKPSEVRSFSLAPYPVPDTGQTESYTDTLGEDSDYDINPQSFTKLDAEGNALDANASAWAMVRDNVTGLIWEVKTDDGSIHDKDNTYNWQDSASTFIDEINRSNFGGHNTWRLPTIRELSTLAQHDAYEPAINNAYFPNTALEGYWSSNEVGSATNNAWCAWMIGGGAGFTEKTALLSARAVYIESNPGNPNPIFIDNDNGTVSDQRTGLMWQKEFKTGDGETVWNWEKALEYCENLELAGHDDWRLPTVRELQSIMDYQKTDPALDSIFTFDSDRPENFFWTSTSYARPNSNNAFYVDLGLGRCKSDKSKNEADFLVRAVRSSGH